MRTIQRALFALFLMGGIAFAAEPKAVITGPTAIRTGDRILLELLGTVSDGPPSIFCEGPEVLRPVLAYSLEGDKKPPIFAFANPSKPGTYRFVLVAISAKGGSPYSEVSAATWEVLVTSGVVPPEPNPPTPQPTPEPVPPTPPPPPSPPPATYSGPLWGVLVLPENPTPGQSFLSADQTIRKEFAARSARFYAVPFRSSEIQTESWNKVISGVGGPPCVIWLKPDGSQAIPPSKTVNAETILNALRSIRGK